MKITWALLFLAVFLLTTTVRATGYRARDRERIERSCQVSARILGASESEENKIIRIRKEMILAKIAEAKPKNGFKREVARINGTAKVQTQLVRAVSILNEINSQLKMIERHLERVPSATKGLAQAIRLAKAYAKALQKEKTGSSIERANQKIDKFHTVLPDDLRKLGGLYAKKAKLTAEELEYAEAHVAIYPGKTPDFSAFTYKGSGPYVPDYPPMPERERSERTGRWSREPFGRWVWRFFDE